MCGLVVNDSCNKATGQLVNLSLHCVGNLHGLIKGVGRLSQQGCYACVDYLGILYGENSHSYLVTV